MAVTVLTDHPAITALLDRFIAVDPVRTTMLGTIGSTLEATAWAATDGAGLAVRSTSEFPVVIAGASGAWTPARR